MPRSASCLFALLFASTTVIAADWPRFRGPNGTGVVDDAATPVVWKKSDVLWSVPIPGVGHSSPIVVGDRAFLQSAAGDGSKRMLVCVDAAKGKVEWVRDVPGAKSKIHAKNSLASSTPASDGERVFGCFWDGETVTIYAYDFKGNKLWSYPLGSYRSQHGAGMSPVVAAGKVFVNFDQDGDADVVAVDAKTGQKAWTASRKAYRACTSTPFVRELAGGKQELVVASTAGLAGYDPENGNANWVWNWTWGPGKMALRTVASPLVVGDRIVIASGDGSGTRSTVSVVPGETPRLEWEKTKDTPYVPCPVAKGDHLYWVRDDGFATCAEQKTGNVVWSERIFSKAISSSPILVGDTVFAIAEDGKAVAFKASSAEFEKVGESNVGEAVFASPAAANGKLYIRGAEHLVCIGKKK